MSPATLALYLLYAFWYGVLSVHLRSITSNRLHGLSSAERWFRSRATPLADFAWKVPTLCRVNNSAFLIFACWRFGIQTALWLFAGQVVAFVIGWRLAVMKPASGRAGWAALTVGLAGSFSYPLTVLLGIAAWVAALL